MWRLLKLSLIIFLWTSDVMSLEVVLDPYQDLNYEEITVYDYRVPESNCVEVYQGDGYQDQVVYYCSEATKQEETYSGEWWLK